MKKKINELDECLCAPIISSIIYTSQLPQLNSFIFFQAHIKFARNMACVPLIPFVANLNRSSSNKLLPPKHLVFNLNRCVYEHCTGNSIIFILKFDDLPFPSSSSSTSDIYCYFGIECGAEPQYNAHCALSYGRKRNNFFFVKCHLMCVCTSIDHIEMSLKINTHGSLHLDFFFLV